MRVNIGLNIPIILLVLMTTSTKTFRVYSEQETEMPSQLIEDQLKTEIEYCKSYGRSIAQSLEAMLGLVTRARTFCSKRLK